jgi:eukaryotic-like serine/threonine-protein kinase
VVADENDPGDLPEGAELPGGYIIEQPAVQGRTRLIYAARSTDNTLVAVHVLDAGLVDGLGEWFLQGAAARAEVQHPTLPRTIAFGRLADGRPYEVTDFLEGTSMREALETSPEGLDALAVVHVINELGAALDALHARTPPVVHRTLCPEHLMVLRDTHEVRLLGLFFADRPQFEGVRPGYRSAEELAGVLSLGPRADVFSLATVAYELLTGRPAWPHVPELALDAMRVGVRDRVSVLRPALPAAVDVVLERAWSLSPDARQSSAGRFAKALRTAIDPLDLGASLGSNVFDDRPTAQVPTLIARVRNNTLLNAGAVAQAIIPRGEVGAVRASASDDEGDARASRPPPARMLRAPVAPGARSPREKDSEPPKIAVPLPEDIMPPEPDPELPGEETPISTAAPEPTGPTDVVAVVPSASEKVVASTPAEPQADPKATPTPAAASVPAVPAPAASTAREPTAPAQPEAVPAASTQPAASAIAPMRGIATEPLDEPTPLPSTPSRFEPPSVAGPSPSPAMAPAAAMVPAAAAVSRATAPPPPASFHSPLDAPPIVLGPESREPRPFLDEPTTVIHTIPAAAASWTRSPVAMSALFIAHAVLIVGIAHAIAYGMAQRQPVPAPQLIPAPPATCAPCAACPSASALPLPLPESPAAPGATRPAIRTSRASAARPAARTQLIRSMPNFGRAR